MEFSIKKGKRDFCPRDSIAIWLTSRLKSIYYEVYFHESCLYDMGKDKDQLDWNKGGGVSFHMFTNTDDAIMWVWRSLPKTREIEVTMYWHIKNSGKKFHVSKKTFKVKIEKEWSEKIEIELIKLSDKDWTLLISDSNTTETIDRVTIRKDFLLARSIGVFFGGENNSEGEFGGVAPQEMKLRINRQKILRY